MGSLFIATNLHEMALRMQYERRLPEGSDIQYNIDEEPTPPTPENFYDNIKEANLRPDSS